MDWLIYLLCCICWWRLCLICWGCVSVFMVRFWCWLVVYCLVSVWCVFIVVGLVLLSLLMVGLSWRLGGW